MGSGGTLAYLSGGARQVQAGWRFVAVSRDGAERKIDMPPGFHFVGRLSPDGRQIALLTTTTAAAWRNPDIWRFELDSRVLTRVTTDSASVYPAWSADGERIAFARIPADTAIFWRPLYAAGQTTALFHSSDSIRAISLGPAHGYAALRVVPGNNRSADIWLVHLDSLDKPRPFLAEPYTETAPDLSRDGRLLAYTTNRTGRNEVYVRSVAGSPELQISPDGGNEPRWGREAGELYYRGPDRMMAVRLAERPRLAVTQRDSLFRDIYIHLGAAGNAANYDVFPGGREFLMTRAEGRSNEQGSLMVLLNWPLRRVSAVPAPD